ncbi:MAG: threonine synthase [Bacteroidetes bacterium]|nr:threonine synthase [Bacteroidota bacterium]MBL6943304.1 threonine synthase [Bacteroidales bacterium]
MNNSKFHYQCVDCGATYNESQVTYLCPDCTKLNSLDLPPVGVLKTNYDYLGLIELGVNFEKLSKNKFLDLLPISKLESLPNLKVGQTPLYEVRRIGNLKLSFNLFLKDDSQNPTYSFKDRASAVVSAYAKEKGWDIIVAASTGNAGSSLAGICAAQGQKAIIIVPESAPIAKLTQILMHGATIIPVKGTYDDTFDLSIKATKEFGWYNRNTAFNPLTIEGKKTVAFELLEQLNFTVPDRIFVPVGDGVIISGVYKGFEDLLKLQIIDNMPIIVGVQSQKSDNLVRNIDNATFEIKKSTTIADSISVDIPRNFYMTQKYIHDYNGEYISVTDDEILKASSILSKNTGLFAEPAAAAAFAGLLSYKKANKLPDNSNNVVLLTGSGLKDLRSVSGLLNVPDSIWPTLENLKKLLS